MYMYLSNLHSCLHVCAFFLRITFIAIFSLKISIIVTLLSLKWYFPYLSVIILIKRFQFLRNPSSYIFPYLQHDKMLILCILVHLQFNVLARIMQAPIHVYDATGFNNLGSAWCRDRHAVGLTCSRARLLARDIDFGCGTEYMSYHNFSKWIDRYFEKGTDWVSGIL